MRLRTLFLVFPWLWLFVTAFTQISGHPWTTNSATVRRTGQAVLRFQEDQGRLPESLSELREYAESAGMSVDLYDNYGNRLFYLPLTETGFFVKSFGRDAAENTILISRDDSFSHNIPFPPRGVKMQISKESRMNFYQGIVLDGLEAPRGNLVASLQSRFRGGIKRLVIQNAGDKQFFMASAHDAVEEFIWMPSGSEIVFTAHGSTRYEDGLYYWNLQTNQTRNLLPELRKAYFPNLPEDKTILLSLSHASAKPDFLYIFAYPQPSDGILDPKAFYRYHNFYALHPKKAFASERVVADRDFSIFDYTMDHKALVAAEEGDLSLPAQKAWLDISLENDKQTMLEEWQEFCSTYASSASLPYALWWLASIYNDTYRQLLRENPEHARTVRNFAVEISEALGQLPSSPLYLKGFAEYLKKSLLLSKPAPYNVTPLVDTARHAEPENQAESPEPAAKRSQEPESPGQNPEGSGQKKSPDAMRDKPPLSQDAIEMGTKSP